MPPYTDMPSVQMPTGASPGSLPSYAQQSATYIQMQGINGVTYFVPQPQMQVPAQFTVVHKDTSNGQSGQKMVSSDYNSLVPEQSQTQVCENSQEVYQPGHMSSVSMSHHTPNTSAPLVYTTTPSQPILIPQAPPQMIHYVPMHTTPPQPAYHFQPIQEYSPANSVQYSSGSPAFTAYSTPVCGPSPAPSSTAGSRASTPHSGACAHAQDRSGESLSTRLEVVWHGHFSKLFRTYADKWSLEPVEDPGALGNEGVHKYMDSAKVRFICPTCSNCWTSMKGRVYFLYVLDPIAKQGFVYFKLFGQKCSKCTNEEYVHSMWYADEIEKVVENIHQKVGQTYYGITTPVVRVDRRRGQPKKPHPLTSCQACDMGICKEEHNFR